MTTFEFSTGGVETLFDDVSFGGGEMVEFKDPSDVGGEIVVF